MERHARVENGKLIVGKCEYEYVMLPKVYNLSKNTTRLFEEFYAQGGKILFTDGLPEYLEGEKHTFNFASTVTFEEIEKAQPYTIDVKNSYVASTLRRYEGKDYIFATNISMNDKYTVTFSGNFKGFTSLDLETMQTKEVGTTLDFTPGQAYVLFFNDKEKEYEPIIPTTSLGGEFKVIGSSDNYLTLDKPRYSFDGVNYSERLRYMGIFYEMLERRYQGDLYLKYEFTVKDIPERIAFLTEDMNNIECTLNGKKMVFDGVSDFEKKNKEIMAKNRKMIPAEEFPVKFDKQLYERCMAAPVRRARLKKLFALVTLNGLLLPSRKIVSFSPWGAWSYTQTFRAEYFVAYEPTTKKGFVLRRSLRRFLRCIFMFFRTARLFRKQYGRVSALWKEQYGELIDEESWLKIL